MTRFQILVLRGLATIIKLLVNSRGISDGSITKDDRKDAIDTGFLIDETWRREDGQ